MEEKRKMSSAFMHQVQHKRNLNECLHPQRYYIEFDVKDPEGKLVCEAAMSYDQFVRLLICQSDVHITLLRYRGLDGKLIEEIVPEPDSVYDKMVSQMGDSGESLGNRITDLKKDVYELMNSGKSVGKKALEKLFMDIKTIEGHYESNIPYFVECAAEQVTEIQENAKSQLAIFAQNLMKVDLNAEDFSPLLEGKSALPLPNHTVVPIEEEYKLKEREQKSIDDMTAMEVADVLTVKLRRLEAIENKYYNEHKGDEDRKHFFGSHASSNGNKVTISYINYQGSSQVELDVAKRYLKFLNSIKSLGEFKTAYWFEKKE